jgi:hypothetical protein
VGQVEAHFDPFGDRFTVCAECTIGLEINLDAPDGTLGDLGQVKARFGLFRDSVNLSTR